MGRRGKGRGGERPPHVFARSIVENGAAGGCERARHRCRTLTSRSVTFRGPIYGPTQEIRDVFSLYYAVLKESHVSLLKREERPWPACPNALRVGLRGGGGRRD